MVNLEDWLGRVVRGKYYVRNGLVYVKGNVVIEYKHWYMCGKVMPCQFEHVMGSWWVKNIGLETLGGSPKIVGGSFECSENDLVTLVGGPRFVGKSYWCEKNKLRTLDGAPKRVGESFFCEHNELVSLGGSLREVGERVYCGKNKFAAEVDYSFIKVNKGVIWR